MPKRSSKKETPQDMNVLAARIVEEATQGDILPIAEQEAQTKGKNPNAVALGRLGGVKGGPARAKKLTPEQRKSIARKAAYVRWSSKSR